MSRFGQRSSPGKYLVWTSLWAAIGILSYVGIDAYLRLNSRSITEEVTPPAKRPYVELSIDIPTWEFAERIVETDDMTNTIRELVREKEVDRKASAEEQWLYAEDYRLGDSALAHWLAVAVYHPEDIEKSIRSLVISAGLLDYDYQSQTAERRMLEYAEQVASASEAEDVYKDTMEHRRSFEAMIESASGP